jgi:hypothetical protein
LIAKTVLICFLNIFIVVAWWGGGTLGVFIISSTACGWTRGKKGTPNFGTGTPKDDRPEVKDRHLGLVSLF